MWDHPDEPANTNDTSWLLRARRRAWHRARLEGTASTPSLDAPATPPSQSGECTTTSRAEADVKSDGESAITFEHLPDDLLYAVASVILAMETRAAVIFCTTNKRFRSLGIIDVARERRVRWLADWTEHHDVCGDERTLIAVGPTAGDGTTLHVDEGGATRSWAVGTLLPMTGVSQWSVRIDKCFNGRMVLGACEQAGTCGWGIEPYSGVLNRYTRDEQGDVNMFGPVEAPAGCPDGQGQRLMAGTLRATAEGSVVEFELDADRGILSFIVDEGGDSRRLSRAHAAFPKRYELRGFPPGVALRPWAMLYLHLGDQVTLSGCVESR